MSSVDNIKDKVKNEKDKSVLERMFGNQDQTEEVDQIEEVKEVEEVEEKTDNQNGDQTGSPEVIEETAVIEEMAAGKEEESNKEDGDQIMENFAKELSEILKEDDKKKKAKPEMVGIYFDTDVKRALDKYQKDEGRGAKSELLNKLARLALTQKGYLKKGE